MDMLYLPENGNSGNGNDFLPATEALFLDIENDLELLEPQITFEESLVNGNAQQTVRLATLYRDDEEAITNFWILARDYEDGPALAVVSMMMGATYGDSAFEMVLEA